MVAIVVKIETETLKGRVWIIIILHDTGAEHVDNQLNFSMLTKTHLEQHRTIVVVETRLKSKYS